MGDLFKYKDFFKNYFYKSSQIIQKKMDLMY